MRKPANWFFRFWVPIFLWAVLIFFLSSLPESPAIIEIPHIDKALHFLEYLLLALLLLRALRNTTSLTAQSALFITIIMVILYGISDEFHQSFVPNRSASGWDILFDALGGISATIMYKFKRVV